MVYLKLKYNIKKDKFSYSSNMRDERIADIVVEFLRIQMGKGADRSEPEKRDKYKIEIWLDLNTDTFVNCKDNCGNLGLRDGILMRFIKTLT
jgi:hypothetical protein